MNGHRAGVDVCRVPIVMMYRIEPKGKVNTNTEFEYCIHNGQDLQQGAKARLSEGPNYRRN